MIHFKKNLILLRAQKSMTLKDIAMELGFSPSQWSNYEQGISYPKFLDLIKISEYFNISETDLIHANLEQKKVISEIKTQDQKEIIILQSKLLKIQEEKINIIKLKISQLQKK